MDEKAEASLRLAIEAIGTGVAELRAENAQLRDRLAAAERRIEMIATSVDRASRRD